jgi:hypothetical protein
VPGTPPRAKSDNVPDDPFNFCRISGCSPLQTSAREHHNRGTAMPPTSSPRRGLVRQPNRYLLLDHPIEVTLLLVNIRSRVNDPPVMIDRVRERRGPMPVKVGLSAPG